MKENNSAKKENRFLKKWIQTDSSIKQVQRSALGD